MKKRFYPFLMMLLGLFTLSSAFNSANAAHFATIPLSGTEGTCTFTGELRVLSLSNDGQSVVASGNLVGSIVNTMGTADPSDDVTTAVFQPVSGLSVNLEGTSCTTLNLTSTEDIVVGSTCGAIELSFTDASTFFYATRPGGPDNLIFNSLCAIARYYENGNASINSLFAHVDNLQRAITRD